MTCSLLKMKLYEVILVLGLLCLHQGARGNPLRGDVNVTVQARSYEGDFVGQQVVDEENLIGYEAPEEIDMSYKVPLDRIEQNVTTTTWRPKYVVDAPLRPKCPQGYRYHKPTGICRRVIGVSSSQ